MSSSLRYVLRSLTAFIAILVFLQPCLCDLLPPDATITLAAHEESPASPKTGCCPGGEDDDDEGDTALHHCDHCDVEATLVADIQFSVHNELVAPPSPTPFVLAGVPFFDLGTTWRPLVEPIAIRRANPPPDADFTPSVGTRLALLAMLRC